MSMYSTQMGILRSTKWTNLFLLWYCSNKRLQNPLLQTFLAHIFTGSIIPAAFSPLTIEVCCNSLLNDTDITTRVIQIYKLQYITIITIHGLLAILTPIHVTRTSRSFIFMCGTTICEPAYSTTLQVLVWLLLNVMAEQKNTTGAAAAAAAAAGVAAFILEALGKILSDLQFGPYERKVKKYLDEATTG